MNIFPLGTDAVTVEFGREISVALNDRVRRLERFLGASPFPGLLEIVPAYASLTVFYDLIEVRRGFPAAPTAFAAVRDYLLEATGRLPDHLATDGRLIEIPVSFAQDCAPDLAYVAELNDLTADEVISIFTGAIYRVFMLGFIPGFAYMGELDARIAAPRKSSPRLKVPAGSVGIAGRQTGIYPTESPGGWQLVGRTETRLFTPQNDPPTFLQAGDRVRFFRV